MNPRNLKWLVEKLGHKPKLLVEIFKQFTKRWDLMRFYRCNAKDFRRFAAINMCTIQISIPQPASFYDYILEYV